MKKSARCVAQTINLSNPKTCVKPKGSQKFAGADAAETRPDFNRTNNYWITRPVAVRVCTRWDMQRPCPPKLQDCPQKPLPLTSGEKLCRTTMFLVKSVIATGLVYWTWSEGLWSDNTKTEDLYYRMMSAFAPDQPAEDTQLSLLEEIKYSISEAYNSALVKSMDFVVGVPLEIHRKLRDLLFPCNVIKETGSTTSRRSDEKSTEV